VRLSLRKGAWSVSTPQASTGNRGNGAPSICWRCGEKGLARLLRPRAPWRAWASVLAPSDYPRGSYHLGACVLEGDARNSQEAVFLVGVPVRLFLLERRRSRFSPQGVVPGNRLQSIMAGLKDHRRVSRFALNVVKLDGDLAPRIGPMSKGRDGAFAKVLCYRSRSVRTEAYAERRPGGPGRVGGIGRFRTVDAGIFRRGKRGSCDQRQDNRGAGYEKMQWSGSGSHNVLIIALG
jgi:hypothetical protein